MAQAVGGLGCLANIPGLTDRSVTEEATIRMSIREWVARNHGAMIEDRLAQFVRSFDLEGGIGEGVSQSTIPLTWRQDLG